MTKRELIARHRDAILALAAKHGATNVRLFGSVARGEESEGSDIDFLAQFHGKEGFDAFGQQFDFEQDLSRLLGSAVHVVRDHRFLKPRFRQNVERDLCPL